MLHPEGMFMADLKEVEQLQADLELVTKTAKVLATKLEKMSVTFEALLASLGEKPIPKIKTPSMESMPIEPPSKITQPAPKPTVISDRIDFDSKADSRAGRLLDSFLGQLQGMKTGKEISDSLSRLRDQVMQSADVGFHPAFHEMGREASRIRNLREITPEERDSLIEKIYDWKTRLTG